MPDDMHLDALFEIDSRSPWQHGVHAAQVVLGPLAIASLGAPIASAKFAPRQALHGLDDFIHGDGRTSFGVLYNSIRKRLPRSGSVSTA